MQVFESQGWTAFSPFAKSFWCTQIQTIVETANAWPVDSFDLKRLKKSYNSENEYGNGWLNGPIAGLFDIAWECQLGFNQIVGTAFLRRTIGTMGTNNAYWSLQQTVVSKLYVHLIISENL